MKHEVMVEDYKNKHEGEQMIVVGNGPGLKNIPPAFIESRPYIALNFFQKWYPFMHPTYWFGSDPKVVRAWADIHCPAFVAPSLFEALREELAGIDPLATAVWSPIDSVPGLQDPVGGRHAGIRYNTSLAAALHLAIYMGASPILIVGFDCTYNPPGVMTPTGLSNIPHFYDDKDGAYKPEWDSEIGALADYAYDHFECRVFNLSEPTMATRVEQGDWLDWWERENF